MNLPRFPAGHCPHNAGVEGSSPSLSTSLPVASETGRGRFDEKFGETGPCGRAGGWVGGLAVTQVLRLRLAKIVPLLRLVFTRRLIAGLSRCPLRKSRDELAQCWCGDFVNVPKRWRDPLDLIRRHVVLFEVHFPFAHG